MELILMANRLILLISLWSASFTDRFVAGQLSLIDSGEYLDAVRSSNGAVLCATDLENAVSTPITSRGQCAHRCRTDANCLFINYRDSNKQQPVCDMFDNYPCNFSVVPNCMHYRNRNQPLKPACPDPNCVTCCTNYGKLLACRYDGCAPGYYNNNSGLCADINECASNPCLNGASCLNQVNRYQCICAAGFAGVRCEININECASNPCWNGGWCSDQVNGYICTCAAGFDGVNCQINIDECASSPCLYYGTCVDGINQFTCNCVRAFTGLRCESLSNACTVYNGWILNGAAIQYGPLSSAYYCLAFCSVTGCYGVYWVNGQCWLQFVCCQSMMNEPNTVSYKC